MGCDIHAYIEYYSKQDYNKDKRCFVDCFSSQIDLGRNYILFGLLAGVRSMCDSVVPVKGIPTDPEMSYICKGDYYLNVVDDEEFKENQRMYTSGWCKRTITRSEAESYATDSLWKGKYANAEKTIMIDPSWHTPTWLTLPELQEVRKQYLLEQIEFYSEVSGKAKKELLKHVSSLHASEMMRYTFIPHESKRLLATIHAMNALEKASGELDYTTRLVCWFDS